MSDEEGSFWINMAEKVFGVVLIIIGAVLLYFTGTSIDPLGAYSGLFVFLGVAVLAAGFFLIIVKPPE